MWKSYRIFCKCFKEVDVCHRSIGHMLIMKCAHNNKLCTIDSTSELHKRILYEHESLTFASYLMTSTLHTSSSSICNIWSIVVVCCLIANRMICNRVCEEYKMSCERAIKHPQSTDELLELKKFIENMETKRTAELEALVRCANECRSHVNVCICSSVTHAVL